MSGRSSFFWAMRLLPKRKRDGIGALYGYCRRLDDIADGEAEVTEKSSQLHAFREDIERLFSGQEPRYREVRQLTEAARSFNLQRDHLLAPIEGMELDLSGRMLLPTLADLQHYAYCVAGAVGLSTVRIFGASGADEFAKLTGRALQYTNILRDVAEDALEGRIYVPGDLLDGHPPPSSDSSLVDFVKSEPFHKACEALFELAETAYGEAYRSLPTETKGLGPAVAMMGAYRRLLDEIRKAGWPAVTSGERVRIRQREAALIAVRTLGPRRFWPDYS